jgi:hypothetical protein
VPARQPLSAAGVAAALARGRRPRWRLRAMRRQGATLSPSRHTESCGRPRRSGEPDLAVPLLSRTTRSGAPRRLTPLTLPTFQRVATQRFTTPTCAHAQSQNDNHRTTHNKDSHQPDQQSGHSDLQYRYVGARSSPAESFPAGVADVNALARIRTVWHAPALGTSIPEWGSTRVRNRTDEKPTTALQGGETTRSHRIRPESG